MGQVKIVNPEQELLLNEFRKDSLSSEFYFTGGTALSLHYLQHRLSVDLDFFSESPFDSQIILSKVNNWAAKLNATVEYFSIADVTHVFNLTFPNKQVVKIDFAHYPYKRVKKSQIINGIQVDSLLDIAINKLLTVQQRTEVKDFVDLYFLLQQFTVWDLIEGVKLKFKVKIDPFIVGSDFLKIENFDFMPEMIKPLTLDDLKSFFRQKAKEITGKSIE